MKVCSIDGCEGDVKGRGWCGPHYYRWRTHGDPTAGMPTLTTRRSLDHGDGTRTCSKCGERKALDDYPRDPKGAQGRKACCRVCHREASTRWYQREKERLLPGIRERRVINGDAIREQGKTYYRRDRAKRIEQATAQVHVRRARLSAGPKDRDITTARLRERDGDACCYCGVDLDFTPGVKGVYNPRRASLDHETPVSQRGGHTWDNVALCCLRCNLRKGPSTREQWLVRMEREQELLGAAT